MTRRSGAEPTVEQRLKAAEDLVMSLLDRMEALVSVCDSLSERHAQLERRFELMLEVNELWDGS